MRKYEWSCSRKREELSDSDLFQEEEQTTKQITIKSTSFMVIDATDVLQLHTHCSYYPDIY